MFLVQQTVVGKPRASRPTHVFILTRGSESSRAGGSGVGRGSGMSLCYDLPKKFRPSKSETRSWERRGRASSLGLSSNFCSADENNVKMRSLRTHRPSSTVLRSPCEAKTSYYRGLPLSSADFSTRNSYNYNELARSVESRMLVMALTFRGARVAGGRLIRPL